MSDTVSSGHKGAGSTIARRHRRLLQAVFLLSSVGGVVFLIFWAVLHPTKPTFILQDATIFKLNVSNPNVISINAQVTVAARNPNTAVGIYYSNLRAYATYRGQQITYFTGFPPVYQGHKDFNVWSTFIYGDSVPVAPYSGLALAGEKAEGSIPLTVRINGQIKWRVGSLVTGRYHLHVSCPAVIRVGNAGNVVGIGVKYQLSQSCSVNV